MVIFDAYAKSRILNVNSAIYAIKKPDIIVSDLFYYYEKGKFC